MWHKSQLDFVINYLVKPTGGTTKVEMIDHMPLLQTWMLWKNSSSNNLTQ